MPGMSFSRETGIRESVLQTNLTQKEGLALSARPTEKSQGLGVHGVRFRTKELAQNVLQDAAVRVVLGFLRCVDAHQRFKCNDGILAATRFDFDLPPGCELLDQLMNPADLEDLLAGQLQCFGVFPGEELQRQNSHADEVRTVYAFVAFCDDRANTEQTRALGSPIAR